MIAPSCRPSRSAHVRRNCRIASPNSRRVFGERNRIIQEASQYVMAQIDRAVEMVTQQVAISRGINLVLNRAQILGATSEFDMTPAVVDDLNKVLANVVIPPEGVSPMA